MVAIRVREVTAPLYSTLMRLYLEYPTSRSGAPNTGKMWSFWRVERRVTKTIRGRKHLSYEDRLKELVLFSLEKRRLHGDLITAFQHLKGNYI